MVSWVDIPRTAERGVVDRLATLPHNLLHAATKRGVRVVMETVGNFWKYMFNYVSFVRSLDQPVGQPAEPVMLQFWRHPLEVKEEYLTKEKMKKTKKARN